MKNGKWIFVLLSLAALLSMAGIGIAVGERSALGIVFAIVMLCAVMGIGFKKKKEYIDAGIL